MTLVTKCMALPVSHMEYVTQMPRWWTIPVDGKFDHKPFLVDDSSIESIAMTIRDVLVSVMRTIWHAASFNSKA